VRPHIFPSQAIGLLVPRPKEAGHLPGGGWPDVFVAASIFVVLALALVSIALPVVTIGFDVEKSYNEGWNVYHAAQVAAGEPLYTGDPARLVNYPFLSFYLVAWLKPIFGNVLLIGRGLNLTAFAMTAVLSALIIRVLSGGAIEMLFGAACVIGFQAIQAIAWIGTDEPQMLAEALMLGGLLCYLSGNPTARRLAVCAVLFAAGGFIKQNLVAIPLAVTLDLLFKDRRQFAIWCLCGATAVAAFVGLSEALTGNTFWADIFAPRAFRWSGVAYHARKLAIAFKWPLLASAIYLIRPQPASQRVLMRSYGAIALISGLIFSGGYGVAGNIYLDFTVFMGLTAGLALGGLRVALRDIRPGLRTAILLPLVFALPIVTRSPYYGLTPLDLPATIEDYRQREAASTEAKLILQRQTGPVLCESLLLCFEAGQPLLLDPFSANGQILVGGLSEASVIADIAQHRFSLIELPTPIHPDPGDPHRFAPYLLNQARFNEHTLGAIDRFYVPIFQTVGAVLLEPRGP
jgi:hypothetical protein